jgi:DnaJ-class molecular chaperone
VATIRKRPTSTPKAKEAGAPCDPCKGSGLVAQAVRVGRGRQKVGDQQGTCIACWGTGENPDPQPS